MRHRTIAMLVLMIICGLGIGLLASFHNGLYSAICLFLFPIFTALMFLFISIDIANPPKAGALRKKDTRKTGSARIRNASDDVSQRQHPAHI